MRRAAHACVHALLAGTTYDVLIGNTVEAFSRTAHARVDACQACGCANSMKHAVSSDAWALTVLKVRSIVTLHGAREYVAHEHV